MQASILEKALELGFSDARFAPDGTGSVLLLFCAYRLYDAPPDPGRIALSNYYVASNRGYRLAGEMLTFLRERRIIAELRQKYGLKQVAAAVLGAQGKNTLFYPPE
jgi:hypothetical protein